MNPDNIDYRAVRREVEAEIHKQKRLARWTFAGVSALLFVVFSVVAAAMLSSGRDAMPSSATAPLIMLWVGWLTSVIFQFVSPLLDTKAAEDSLRERLVARAIGTQLLRLGNEDAEASEKRKPTYALSDDGEIEVVEPPESAAGAEDVTDEQVRRAMRR